MFKIPHFHPSRGLLAPVVGTSPEAFLRRVLPSPITQEAGRENATEHLCPGRSPGRGWAPRPSGDFRPRRRLQPQPRALRTWPCLAQHRLCGESGGPALPETLPGGVTHSLLRSRSTFHTLDTWTVFTHQRKTLHFLRFGSCLLCTHFLNQFIECHFFPEKKSSCPPSYQTGVGRSSQIGVPPAPRSVLPGVPRPRQRAVPSTRTAADPICLSFLHWAARFRQLFGVSASLGPRTPCRPTSANRPWPWGPLLATGTVPWSSAGLRIRFTLIP